MSRTTVATPVSDQVAVDRPGLGGGRRSMVFNSVWLLYLSYPFRAIVAYDGPALWTVAAVVGLIAFGAVYLIGFRAFRASVHAGRPVRIGYQWMIVVILVLLLIPVAPAAGDSVLTGCVFLGVLGIMTLPLAQGVVVVAVNVAAVEVLPRVIDAWTPDDSAGFTVLISAFAAWGISQLIFRNAQLTEARRKLSELAVVEERERLGRDVHDILGHSLTVITMKAELAGRLVDLDAEAASKEIADIESLSRAALADVRATVGGLRHLRLDTELRGVRSAVEAAGMTMHTDGSAADVDEDCRELFAWALREAVTNAVRHSRGTQCRVRLGRRRITIVDNGVGPQGESSGSGLRGLADRADAQGASVRCARGAEGGFELSVTVP